MSEIWKDIKDYEGIYQVSNNGNIKNIIRNKYLKPRLDAYGYLRVILYKKGTHYKNFQVHRLVAQAFIPNLENKPQVDHINTIRTDNKVENLRWVTYKENNLNSITLEKYKNMKHWEFTKEIKQKMSESAKKRVRLSASEETKHRQSLARKKWWSTHKARKEEV